MHLADCVEWFHFTAGAERAMDVAQQRRGTQFDPDLVDRFCRHGAEVLSGVGEISAWEEVIALDPRLGEELDDDGLDNALEALGDFADLKSPCRTGHSRGVAAITERVATEARPRPPRGRRWSGALRSSTTLA